VPGPTITKTPAELKLGPIVCYGSSSGCTQWKPNQAGLPAQAGSYGPALQRVGVVRAGGIPMVGLDLRFATRQGVSWNPLGKVVQAMPGEGPISQAMIVGRVFGLSNGFVAWAVFRQSGQAI